MVKVSDFFKRNIPAVVLALLLILVFIWFSVKIDNNKNHFENEKIQLITKYETERDSLQINNLVFASSVFSWSIRSEMLRNNMENLNQLLTVFVKKSGANVVQLVNPDTKIVLVSSDEKFEGNPYPGKLDYELSDPIVLKEASGVRILTPVMGFNNTIGILVVEF